MPDEPLDLPSFKPLTAGEAPEPEVAAEGEGVPPEPPPSGKFREHARWFARMALMVFVLAAAGFLSFITAIRFAIQGREVRVPQVAGVQAGVAQTALGERGLAMRIVDRIYSDLPVDHVVRQSPAAGAFIKTTQRVHVVLSLGPQKVSIPELEGKSLRAARIELLRAGLQIGEVSSIRLPGMPPDLVLKQNPPPRATNAGSPRVNLLVTLPPEEPSYLMPDLAGTSLAEAARRLSEAGLRMARVQTVSSPDTPRGTVVGTDPARGRRITPSTTVEILVVE
jgi:serine/threonine-protein kinase